MGSYYFEHPCTIIKYIYISHLRISLLIWEEEKYWLDASCNVVMCPDKESNMPPFGVWDTLMPEQTYIYFVNSHQRIFLESGREGGERDTKTHSSGLYFLT